MEVFVDVVWVYDTVNKSELAPPLGRFTNWTKLAQLKIWAEKMPNS